MRLLLNDDGETNRCIAAATSCTVHITAQVEDKSTKDSDSNFAENEVVGFSWDASADALVVSNVIDGGTVPINRIFNGYHIYNKVISLKAGDVVTASVNTGNPYVLDTEGNVLSAGSVGSVNYTASADIDVYVGTNTFLASTITFEATDTNGATLDILQEYMESKLRIEVIFSTTDGTKNRDEDEQIFYGLAYITDLSVNAPNRQDSTYTVQLVGDTELTLTQ